MKWSVVILVLFLCNSLEVRSQENNEDAVERIISDRLEALAIDNPDLENDLTYLVERLRHYYEHPIPLNKNCEEAIRELQLLSEIQVKELMYHIEINGPIRAWEELQQLKSLKIDEILTIKPFVRSGADMLTYQNTIEKSSEHHIIIRSKRVIQESRAYKPPKSYSGDPNAVFGRYDFAFKKFLRAGFTLEKDAGEKLTGYDDRITDFQSAFVEFKGHNVIRKLIIGDYKAFFGQGLSYTSVGGMGKSTEVLLIERNTSGINPYRSVNEASFLRGAALETKLADFNIIGFYSNTQLDATLRSTEDGNRFSSIYTSGLHRTENEISKINAIRSITGGINVRYKKNNLELGLTQVSSEFSLPSSERKEFHRLWEKSSANSSVTGMDYKYSKLNYSFFGEISRSHSTGKAMLFGLIFMPDKIVSLALMARQYDADFTPVSSGAFGENTANRNERGFYTGLKIKGSKHWTYAVYSDVFRFSNPSFSSVYPSKGVDYFFETVKRFNKKQELLFRVRWKEKEVDYALENSTLPQLDNEIRKSIRIQFQSEIIEGIRLRSRLEFSEYLFTNIAEQGFLMFHEIKYGKIGKKWSLLGRFTIFDTEGYQSRIYTYEQDLLGAYSIPAFSGKGSKVIAVFRIKMNRNLTFSAKVGHVVYDDRKIVGSGLDEIDGQYKSEVSAQLEVKF